VLTLALGRAHADLDGEILRLAVSARSRGNRAILLVPEQNSHEAERRLCAAGGDSASLFAEVLSFTRLASRVFALAGGLADRTLDASGRLLVMHRAWRLAEGSLRFYGAASRRSAFLQGLVDTADELAAYGIAPEELMRSGEEEGGADGDKLYDLGLLCGSYAALTASGTLDPRDRLTKLSEALETCDFAAGAEVYLGGFTDFTPQERRVIEQMLRQAESVTAALVCDSLSGDEEDVFAPARRTAHQLLAMADRRGARSAVRYFPAEENRPAALRHLEENLFSPAAEPAPSGGAVRLVCALGPMSEVETAAAAIRGLAEEGARWREIAVCARGFSDYEDLVESVFPRYGVPVYLSRRTDFLQKPLPTLITSALDAVTGGWEYEDMFRYLRTGLAGFTPDECDLLENYVLLWRVRGSDWTRERDWERHPEGFDRAWTDEDAQAVARLDALRRRVASPLGKLRAHGGKSAEAHARALYRFLEDLSVAQRLEARAAALTGAGETQEAEETAQLWALFCGVLDQMVSILGEEEMDLGEFGRLLKLALSACDVGTIPVSLDRVTAGDIDRPGSRPVKYLFLLGATDERIPAAAPPGGLLTDDDRARLAAMGFETASGAPARLAREYTFVYGACARPTARLTVSWPRTDRAGGETRPCFLPARLRALFCDLAVEEEAPGRLFRLAAPETALTLAAQEFVRRGESPLLDALEARSDLRDLAGRVRRAASLRRGSLTSAAARALYGKRIALSATKLDARGACHFSYFMRYGLRAKPRRSAGFEAPEFGTFVHAVLEEVLEAARAAGGVKTLGDDWLRLAARRAVDRYAEERLGGLENKTPRFRYLFRRLMRTVYLIVRNVADELRASDFEPVSFELGFGARGTLPPVEVTVGDVTLSVSGFVDRVDGWERDGKLYLRVVDYKTGAKSFDFTDIWNGMGMQTLLYLFALQEKGRALYGAETVPAGALYLPARETILSGSRSADPESLRKKADRELVRRGLLLESPEVLNAMERMDENGPRFLPVKLSPRTGAFTGDALASAEAFGRLSRHLEKELTDIGREIAGGCIDADPYVRGVRSACAWCEFADACHFDEDCGDRRRYLPTLRAAEFWEKIKEEDAK